MERMTREEAKSRLEWICKNHKCLSLESKHCYEAIKMGAEALENQKTGHWIMTGDYYTGAYGSIDYVKCSCCNEDSLEEGNYCPNCGAKMEGEQNETDN